jgi:DNA mismatch repair protein MutL
MSSIQFLDPIVVALIAAGEVIHYPRDIIKELLENALDAKADEIEVTLLQGGIERISVRDNGIGIHHDELHKAIMRHTTSKIKTMEDLELVQSYGFRGEALFTIASVCNFTLKSFPKNQDTGYALFLQGLKREPIIKPVAMHHGTEILCEQLFAPIPVRRQFLKSPRLEMKRSEAMFKNIFLIHPEISARLVANNQLIFNLKKHDHNDFPSRLEEFFHKNKKDWKTIEHVFDMGTIKLWFYEEHTKGLEQYWYQDQRWIADHHFIRFAQQYLSQGILIVQLCLKNEKIDVNTHPQKHTVSFARFDSLLASLGDVFAALQSELSVTFNQNKQIVSLTLEQEPLDSKKEFLSQHQHSFTRPLSTRKILFEDRDENKNKFEKKENAPIKKIINIHFSLLPKNKVLCWNHDTIICFDVKKFLSIQLQHIKHDRLLLPITVNNLNHQKFLLALGIKIEQNLILELPGIMDHLGLGVLVKESITLNKWEETALNLIQREWWLTFSFEDYVSLCRQHSVPHYLHSYNDFFNFILKGEHYE